MVWFRHNPSDFSFFEPKDMPAFINWWESQQNASVDLEKLLFSDEESPPSYFDLLAKKSSLPKWASILHKVYETAQFAYEHQLMLTARLHDRLPSLVTEPNWLEGYRRNRYRTMTPPEIAEIPPQVRQAFKEGYGFDFKWVENISDEARNDIGLILKSELIRNYNPRDTISLLEGVLRRDLVGQDSTAHQIMQWVKQTSTKIHMEIAYRAQEIAITESARMMSLGILSTLEIKGEVLAYVMPHKGSCSECQRLIEGRIFTIETLKKNMFTNLNKEKANWLPSLPLHSLCRHSAMSVPIRYRRDPRLIKVPPSGLLLKNYGLSNEKALQELKLPYQSWDIE